MMENRTIIIKCCPGQIFAVKISLLVGIFSFLFLLSAQALMVPQIRGYVNDYASMISPSVKVDLENKLRSFEQTNSTQIVILTIPSLEGEIIEQFGIKVAETWKIGQRGKDNGVLLIVSKQERKIRIEVGRGLEGKLTDLMAGKIIDQVIKPRFNQGDFDGGFIASASAFIDATRSAFKAEEKHGPASAQSPMRTFKTSTAERGSAGSQLFSLLSIVIILVVLFLVVGRKFLRGFLKGDRRTETQSERHENISVELGSTCKKCNVFYTRGEKFCRKCGELLTYREGAGL